MYRMRKLTPRISAAARRRETKALDLAVAHCGSLSSLARRLKVSYQAVQGWYVTRVPLARCRQIERLTTGAVQCEQLRADYRQLEDRPFRAGGRP